MAGYTNCPDCAGSIPSYSGVCEDCGFSLIEFLNEWAEWSENLPPVETYSEVA